MPAPTTRNLTILLTDIKGFTDKTSHRSRVDIQRMLDEHRDAVLPVLQSKGGRLVKTIGDAFLMAFDSPTDAVLAGVAAQEALAKRNAGVAEQDRIEIRVAINSGEVNLVEGDVFGEPVNIAARIEGVAEAGEVYFTEAVYLSMNKTEVPSSEVGLLQLKGIPEKVRVYKVRRETPFGVGQLPPRPAPAAASPGFASGEKARLAAPPEAKASGPAVFASRRRRAAALALDGLLCWMLLDAFIGGRTMLHVTHHKEDAKTAARSLVRKQSDVRMDEKGLLVEGGDGSRVAIDDSGIHVVAGKDSADEDGGHPRRNGYFALAWVVYNFAFVGLLGGATPGKKILCLRIVTEDGTPPGVKLAAVRAVSSVFSGTVLMLGYAWGLWGCRRTWHDTLAGTRVVPV